MSNQNVISELLLDLSAAEQQLLSGGCHQSPRCCKPKRQKCGEEYPKYDQCPPFDKCEIDPNNGD